MKNTIWKFVLPIDDSVVISMPVQAKILSIQEQYGSLCMWAIVDELAEKEDRHFEIYGTGNPFPDSFTFLHHIGTVKIGSMVWHVFENLSK